MDIGLSKPSDEVKLLGPTAYHDDALPPPQYQPQPIPYPARMQTNQGYDYASAPHVVVAHPMTVIESTHQQDLETVPDYLCLSIFNTLCCCLCFGIAAIIYSSEANAMKYSNHQLAVEKSRTARNLNIAGFACGLVILLCSIIFIVVTVVLQS